MSVKPSPTLETKTLDNVSNIDKVEVKKEEAKLPTGQTAEVIVDGTDATPSTTTDDKAQVNNEKKIEKKGFDKAQAYKYLNYAAIAIAIVAALGAIITAFIPAVAFLAFPLAIVASAAALYVLAPKAVTIIGKKLEERKAAKAKAAELAAAKKEETKDVKKEETTTPATTTTTTTTTTADTAAATVVA